MIEWVSVIKGLPKCGVSVLAYDAYSKVVGEAIHKGDGAFEFVGSLKDDCNVTHWTPLPQPPTSAERKR